MKPLPAWPSGSLRVGVVDEAEEPTGGRSPAPETLKPPRAFAEQPAAPPPPLAVAATRALLALALCGDLDRPPPPRPCEGDTERRAAAALAPLREEEERRGTLLCEFAPPLPPEYRCAAWTAAVRGLCPWPEARSEASVWWAAADDVAAAVVGRGGSPPIVADALAEEGGGSSTMTESTASRSSCTRLGRRAYDESRASA